MKLNGKDIYLSFLKGKSFEHKGEYDASAVYQNTNTIIDCFTYAGNSYYTKQTAPAGTLPTDTTYFGVMASGSVPAELSGFAESERQKSQSKNLLDFNKLTSTTISHGFVSYDYVNKTITFTGSTGGDQFLNIIDLQLKPNTTYTFSVTGSTDYDIYLKIEGNYISKNALYGRNSFTFTTGSSGIVMLRLDNEGGANSTCVFSELMLNEGDTALPYEDYYGEIIHENYFTSRTKIEAGKQIIDNDFVIESYISSDGLTWYRKYASGWKECGGTYLENAEVRAIDKGSFELPLAFSNLNYNIQITPRSYGNSAGVSTMAKTQSNIRLIVFGLVDTDRVNGFFWKCCGY